MRSSRSKLNPGVQAAKPSTNDPRSEVHFIERRLLNDGTIELAHVPVRPDYAARSAALEERFRACCVWTDPWRQSHCRGVLRGVRVRVGQVCGKGGVASHTKLGVIHLNRAGSIVGPKLS